MTTITEQTTVEKLLAFKAYVHQRLDAAGVPIDPESPHKAEGCRIGGRLDIVLKLFAAMPEMLAALKDAKAKLSVLAQDNINYLDCWNRVNEAIKLVDSALPTAPEGTCEQEEPERWDGMA